ncbi:uncharacterized protein LOC143242790 isoform X2 [Tachypleus tridentatus]|uniref:uncharacterized protein LOC143242790 isoform X2 n=1 Tax=Tachypleus tridentatus TaxID=6853 RepID=UPI003FD27809
MAFKFNFPAPCRHVSDAEQDNCEEACEGRICTSEGKVPINRGGETVSPMDTSGVNRISICIGSRNMSLHYSKRQHLVGWRPQRLQQEHWRRFLVRWS